MCQRKAELRQPIPPSILHARISQRCQFHVPAALPPGTPKRPVDPTADLGDSDNRLHPDSVGTLTPSS
jgi:hypothetical protein